MADLIIHALVDEASRVVTTIWILPYVKDTVMGWIQLLAILRQL